MSQQQDFDQLMQFIRNYRGDATHFAKLYERFKNIAAGNDAVELDADAVASLEKHGDAYQKLQATGAEAWPEFETFVSGFEKAVLQQKNGR